MASGVEELMDLLYQLIDEAKGVPLSSDKCIIERDKALDLLDEIRGQFPMELSEAKKLIAGRNDYIASAKREADWSSARRRTGPSRFWQRTSSDRPGQAAGQRDPASGGGAQPRVAQAANAYCEDALRRTEEAVAEAYDEIKKSRTRFRSAAASLGNK